MLNIFELKEAVGMLSNEWDLGKTLSKSEGNICAWIYLMEVLCVSEELVKYKERGKLIGYCGYSKNGSNKHRVRKRLFKFIRNRLYKSKKIKNLPGLKEYEANYSFAPKEIEDKVDGEVSILIVDRAYRGKQIGKKLIEEVFARAKKNHLKTLMILTDEACNYRFYENLGCELIYETTIENKEEKKCGKDKYGRGYIFLKKL